MYSMQEVATNYNFTRNRHAQNLVRAGEEGRAPEAQARGVHREGRAAVRRYVRQGRRDGRGEDLSRQNALLLPPFKAQHIITCI